jgi:hypothetical protein
MAKMRNNVPEIFKIKSPPLVKSRSKDHVKAPVEIFSVISIGSEVRGTKATIIRV